MARKKNSPELKRDVILAKALEMADTGGIESLSIRKLAGELDAGAMSIYYYFKSKDEIIDGMIDSVFAEIALPPDDPDWKEAIRIRCRSVREVLGQHPWASPFMESRRSPGESILRHHDRVIGCFLRAGFSIAVVARAVAVIDAFVFGFALQEASLPGGGGEEMIDMGRDMLDSAFAGYPHLAELTRYALNPDYRFGDIFEDGLDLLLGGFDKYLPE